MNCATPASPPSYTCPIPRTWTGRAGTWPSWAWVQLGGGPTWRPETTLAWEGSLRGGWTGERLRLGLGIRATTPTTLTAFHSQAERGAWDLNLLAGPWIPLGPKLDAGIEGGAALRRYSQQGRAIARDALPMAALEIAARLPLGELKGGPYLRGTVDLDSTSLENGLDDAEPVDLPLWNLSLGFQLGGVGEGEPARGPR